MVIIGVCHGYGRYPTGSGKFVWIIVKNFIGTLKITWIIQSRFNLFYAKGWIEKDQLDLSWNWLKLTINLSPTASSYQNQNGHGYNNQIWSTSFPDSGESFYNNQYSNSIGSYESAGSETNEVYSQEEPELVPIAEFDEEVIFSYDERDPNGPKNWGKISQFCDGSSQSPVNIYSVTTFRERGPPLIIDGYNTLPSNITMTNNGHSASLKFNFADGRPIRIFGGPLNGSFILDNIHWHWGRSDTAGSEHTINSRRLSGEMHLVTYSSQYRSLEDAQDKPKGLAVIGILYEVTN